MTASPPTSATIPSAAATVAGHGCRVAEILARARLPVDTEAALQAAIAAVLDAHRVRYAREVKVTGGRIDFLVDWTGPCGPHTPCTGIEVKIKGGKRAIFKQCDAYCGDPRIGHLVVVTAIALALPAQMRGKPVTVVSIGRSWL